MSVVTSKRCLIVAASIAVFVVATARAAPPKVDYFFPAGVQQGETSEVTAHGTYEQWPVRTWCDQPGVEVTAGEKKGELSIVVADDASAGVCWLRLYDDEGASELRPLVVGMLPHLREVEPNDAPDKPQQIEQPALINGKLSKRGDVDTFSIRLNQGETLVASLQANELLASPMDALLQITDARGFVLEQNNDARGLDPLLTFNAPKDGDYLVRAFAFPSKPNSTIAFAGAEDYVYRLTLTTGAFLDHVLPLAVQHGATTHLRLMGWNLSDEEALHAMEVEETTSDDRIRFSNRSVAGSVDLPIVETSSIVDDEKSTPEAPQVVAVPCIVSGRLTSTKEKDVYQVEATKGQKLEISVDSRSLGFPLDAVLEVADVDGKVLAENDDGSRTQPDPYLTFNAPADGVYVVRIRDLHGRGGMRFAYRLTVEELTPGFSLKLGAGEFAVKRGETLDIPVAIQRENGFAEEIEVTAIDLPNGVLVEASMSQATVESAKTVKLKVSATEEAASGTFRIVGRSSASPRAIPAKFTYDDRPETHQSAWLTVQTKQ